MDPALTSPSAWVVRFAPQVPAAAAVLDVACGGGRHTRFFAARGHPVTAIDRVLAGVGDLRAQPGVELVEADLETGAPPPWRGRSFGGVVVTNYLHRPLLSDIVEAVAPGGVLVYETYAEGNEWFGRPTNPDFLLRPGELLEVVRDRLRVLAYEDLEVVDPRPAAVQRICARLEPPRQAPRSPGAPG